MSALVRVIGCCRRTRLHRSALPVPLAFVSHLQRQCVYAVILQNASPPTTTQDNYFDKPYTRVTPFAIGILLGILFVDRDLVRVRVPPLVSSLMMFVSLGVMGCVIYVDYVNFAPKTKPWSAKEDAAYQSFGRLGFALAVAVVSFTCVNNNHGIVNRFLSMGIWEPLGKLTYGAYLVHPIIIRAYYYQQVRCVAPSF